jgi:hypothetical protein
VGGGGGKAGFSASTSPLMAVDHVVSALIGGRNGAAGVAGAVTVDSVGDIRLTGDGGAAVFTQSVNGGGGSVDLFLDFGDPASTKPSAAARGRPAAAAAAAPTAATGEDGGSARVELGLGGADLDGVAGAAVTQSHRGSFAAAGERTVGLLVQSVGGGGGTAAATLRARAGAQREVTATLGGRNVTASSGGAVTAARRGGVTTGGDFALGGLAQSIGGGGGRLAVAGAGDVALSLGAGGASRRNDGGAVRLSLTGDVLTGGAGASGQIVQSIGAGGGEAALDDVDAARVTLGGTGGATGDGGALEVTNRGDAETFGAGAHGFVLQSIGGGGGLVASELGAAGPTVATSAANRGDGGSIAFATEGYVVARGDDAVGVLAQSLGGGGGAVDGRYRGAVGGAGRGGAVALDLTGDVMALGARGVAVMAQSDGADGGGDVAVALDGVIVGGSGGAFGARTRPGAAGLTSGTAAVVIDGGRDNALTLSKDTFLMSLNDRIVSGGRGSERVLLKGRAVGNVDLGGGVNRLTVARGAQFYARERVDLGAAGLMRVDGALHLGGDPYLVRGALGGGTRAEDLLVTFGVSQVTDVTGSLVFGESATYNPDVFFREPGAPGERGDLINVTGDVTMAGTIRPIVERLDRVGPLVLINAGGTVRNAGVRILGTTVLSYTLAAIDTSTGGEIELVADADFVMPAMNRNERETARYIDRVLAGSGSGDMGPMFALIANMETAGEVTDAVRRLGPEDYAATQVDALYSGLRFSDTLLNCGYQYGAERPDDSRRCAWLTGLATSLDRDATDQYRHLSSGASDLVGGARAAVAEDVYLGIGVGLESVSLTNGPRFAADGDRAQFGVALTRYRGPWEMYGLIGASTVRYDATRRIGISGRLPDGSVVSATTARAKQRVSQANLRLGLGYRRQAAGSAFYVRPGLDLDASYVHAEGATETGTRYALDLQDGGQWVLWGTPSVEVGTDFAARAGGRGRAFLRGEASFASVDSLYVDATFPGASASDGEFRNQSGIGAQTGAVVAGVTFHDRAGLGYVSLGYRGAIGDGLTEQTATLGVGLRF